MVIRLNLELISTTIPEDEHVFETCPIIGDWGYSFETETRNLELING
jgi:hypothetical protein